MQNTIGVKLKIQRYLLVVVVRIFFVSESEYGDNYHSALKLQKENSERNSFAFQNVDILIEKKLWLDLTAEEACREIRAKPIYAIIDVGAQADDKNLQI